MTTKQIKNSKNVIDAFVKVNHDINNYCTTMLYYIENLKNIFKEKRNQDLRKLDIALNKIIYLSKDASKILYQDEVSEKKIDQKTNLFEVFSSIMKEDFFCKNISFKLIWKANNKFISGNLAKIERIFYNLFKNSIEAKRDHDEKVNVCLLVKEINHQMVVMISDNGKGFLEAKNDQLFREFYSTKISLGRGLGLSICKSIIKEYGGDIIAKNKYDFNKHCKGAELTLYFPIENKELNKDFF